MTYITILKEPMIFISSHNSSYHDIVDVKKICVYWSNEFLNCFKESIRDE